MTDHTESVIIAECDWARQHGNLDEERAKL